MHYLPKQWAAVTIQCGEMTAPAQTCLYRNMRDTCQGAPPFSLSVPPTTRLALVAMSARGREGPISVSSNGRGGLLSVSSIGRGGLFSGSGGLFAGRGGLSSSSGKGGLLSGSGGLFLGKGGLSSSCCLSLRDLLSRTLYLAGSSA